MSNDRTAQIIVISAILYLLPFVASAIALVLVLQ